MSVIESGNWNQLPWRPLRQGIKQMTLAMGADAVTVTIGQVESGHELRPHSHPEEQVALCISGECDYYVDGVPYHLTPGGWVTVPAEWSITSMCMIRIFLASRWIFLAIPVRSSMKSTRRF